MGTVAGGAAFEGVGVTEQTDQLIAENKKLRAIARRAGKALFDAYAVLMMTQGWGHAVAQIAALQADPVAGSVLFDEILKEQASDEEEE